LPPFFTLVAAAAADAEPLPRRSAATYFRFYAVISLLFAFFH